MKNLWVLAALSGLLLFDACIGNDVPEGYWRLEGTVVSNHQIDTIYLVENDFHDTIATLFAYDGKLSPFQDSAHIGTFCRLSAIGHQRRVPFGFFPEHGVIHLDLDLTQEPQEIVKVGGTPVNDSLFQYMKICREYDEIHGTVDEWRSNVKKRQAFVRSIVAQYPDHDISQFLIQQAVEIFPSAQMDSLISKLSPRLQLSARVSNIQERNAAIVGSEEGDLIKDCRGIDMNGDSIRLSDYIGHGQYVLIGFWISSCSLCPQTMPMMQDMYKQYQGKGLQVVGITNKADNLDQIRQIEEEQGVTFPQITGVPFMSYYGVYSTPTWLVLDPSGKILFPRSTPHIPVLNELDRILNQQAYNQHEDDFKNIELK